MRVEWLSCFFTVAFVWAAYVLSRIIKRSKKRAKLRALVLANIPDPGLARAVGPMRSLEEYCQAVTFTITTHRRLGSFIEAMSTFLANCTDRHRYVREYLVVDDGSTDADRAVMRERFPECRFIFKSRSDQGHPSSVALILTEVKTPLWLCWEDDWSLDTPTPLISRAMTVMSQEPRSMQVCLNGGWLDTTGHSLSTLGKLPEVEGIPIKYRRISYNQADTSRLNKEYILSEHRKGGPLWPLFSLQPGLNRMEYFRRLGQVITHPYANQKPVYYMWELDYACRFTLGGAEKCTLLEPFASQLKVRSASA